MSVDWRSFPSLAALRAMEATAAEGSFAGAARALNVTHAAVAQQVRALEVHLGVRLVARQGRGIVLTEAGERLADALLDGFGRIERAMESVSESEAKRGLRITTTQFLADVVIMPNLSQFWEKHPGVEIGLFPVRTFVDLEREGFDCGIRVLPPGVEPGWPGLEHRFLKSTTMLMVGSPELVGDGTSDPQDMPWLDHENMSPKDQVMRAYGLDLERLNWVRIGSAQLQLQALKQGLGLSLFNERIARPFLESGELKQMSRRLEGYLDYYAVWPKGPRNPLVDDFFDWLAELL